MWAQSRTVGPWRARYAPGLRVCGTPGLAHLCQDDGLAVPRQLVHRIAVAFIEVHVARHQRVRGQLEALDVRMTLLDRAQKRGADAPALAGGLDENAANRAH